MASFNMASHEKINEEILSEFVRAFPSLYYIKTALYKDRNAKDNAWKEVATNLGVANRKAVKTAFGNLKKIQQSKSGL